MVKTGLNVERAHVDEGKFSKEMDKLKKNRTNSTSVFYLGITNYYALYFPGPLIISAILKLSFL